MTVLYFIRHASHALVDHVLTGRTVDVGLDRFGRLEARDLADAVMTLGISHLHASPRRRTIETAEFLSRRSNIPIEIVPALDEVNFGEWSGRTLADLELDASWHSWNRVRSNRAPAGEGMTEVLARVSQHICCFSRANPNARLAMITHAEVIRAVMLARLRLPWSAWRGVDVAPVSVNELDFDDTEVWLTFASAAGDELLGHGHARS